MFSHVYFPHVSNSLVDFTSVTSSSPLRFILYPVSFMCCGTLGDSSTFWRNVLHDPFRMLPKRFFFFMDLFIKIKYKAVYVSKCVPLFRLELTVSRTLWSLRNILLFELSFNNVYLVKIYPFFISFLKCTCFNCFIFVDRL